MVLLDLLELFSSFSFLSILFLINEKQKYKKYFSTCILFLTLSSLYYHLMDKLYFKYSLVTYENYELSTYLDNYFILILCGNVLLNPFLSFLIASLFYKYNTFKKIYYILIYANTVRKLYKINRKMECCISIITSILVGFCLYDYSIHGWNLINSWIWHLSNLLYLICSCYSEQNIKTLKVDCFKPIRKLKVYICYNYLKK